MSTYTYLHYLDRASRIELQARKLRDQANLDGCIDAARMLARARDMLNHAADLRGRAAGRIAA